MKPNSVFLILILAVFVAGCAGSKYYQKGVAPSNISTIQPGTSRQLIEELLGQPVESEPDGDRQVDTYEYNMGQTADMSKAGPWALSGDPGPCFPCIFIIVGVEMIHQGYLSESAKTDFKKQRGRVKITYTADDTAIAVDVARPESEDGRFRSGQTTRADVTNIMGAEPSLVLRGGGVLVYRETPETLLIIEFDQDLIGAVTTTTACTYSGICIAQTTDNRLPPLVFAPPWEEAIAKDFSAGPEHGCAIYAYSDIKIREEFIDPQVLLLDQQPAGFLHPRGYFWWLVSPGTHILKGLGATSDSKKHSPKMQIDCHPGETYFIRTKTSDWSSVNVLTLLTRRVSQYLDQVGEKKGRKAIGKRRLLMDNFAFSTRVDDPLVGP